MAKDVTITSKNINTVIKLYLKFMHNCLSVPNQKSLAVSQYIENLYSSYDFAWSFGMSEIFHKCRLLDWHTGTRSHAFEQTWLEKAWNDFKKKVQSQCDLKAEAESYLQSALNDGWMNEKRVFSEGSRIIEDFVSGLMNQFQKLILASSLYTEIYITEETMAIGDCFRQVALLIAMETNELKYMAAISYYPVTNGMVDGDTKFKSRMYDQIEDPNAIKVIAGKVHEELQYSDAMIRIYYEMKSSTLLGITYEHKGAAAQKEKAVIITSDKDILPRNAKILSSFFLFDSGFWGYKRFKENGYINTWFKEEHCASEQTYNNVDEPVLAPFETKNSPVTPTKPALDIISVQEKLPTNLYQKLAFINSYLKDHPNEKNKANKITIFFLPEYVKIRAYIESFNKYPDKHSLASYEKALKTEEKFLAEFNHALDCITDKLFDDEQLDLDVSVNVAKQLNQEIDLAR